MTLSELYSKFFSRPSIVPPTTIYFFEDEDSADIWIQNMYFNDPDNGYSLVGVLRSDMKAKYTLQPRWCEAEVQQFYCVEPDVIVAVVTPKEMQLGMKEKIMPALEKKIKELLINGENEYAKGFACAMTIVADILLPKEDK